MAKCTPEHEDSGIASAHGTTASWGGDALGMLTSVQVRAGRAQLVDVTSVNATVIGSGTNSRVLREVGVASVEPAQIHVQWAARTLARSALEAIATAPSRGRPTMPPRAGGARARAARAKVTRATKARRARRASGAGALD